MQKRILVTGGAGYIGVCVIEHLLTEGFKPVVFDSLNWGRESLTQFEDKIEVIEGDCRNSRDIIYALEGINGIIHLAGIVGEFACKNNPQAHFSINVESTRTLVNCCTDPELDLVPDFIYASSCSVYGNVRGIYDIVNEDTPTAPLSEYAHAKIRSEQILLERMHQIPHFHPTILRLTTVFGWSMRPRLDLVTNLFTYNGWKDKHIIVHGGSQYRSLIHVRDVARAFVVALKSPRFLRSGKIFHIGEEKNNVTVKEIAKSVQQIVDCEISIKTDVESDRRDYQISCQKFKNLMGWEASWDLPNGIRNLVSNLDSRKWDWEDPKYRNNSFIYK